MLLALPHGTCSWFNYQILMVKYPSPVNLLLVDGWMPMFWRFDFIFWWLNQYTNESIFCWWNQSNSRFWIMDHDIQVPRKCFSPGCCGTTRPLYAPAPAAPGFSVAPSWGGWAHDAARAPAWSRHRRIGGGIWDGCSWECVWTVGQKWWFHWVKLFC